MATATKRVGQFPVYGTHFRGGKFYAKADVGNIPGTGFFRPEVEITEAQFYAFRRYGPGEKGLKSVPFPLDEIPVGSDGTKCNLNRLDEAHTAGTDNAEKAARADAAERAEEGPIGHGDREHDGDPSDTSAQHDADSAAASRVPESDSEDAGAGDEEE